MDSPSHKESRLPSYLRVAHLLRERIAATVYQIGEFLPPERELAAEFGASRQTIRLAIDLLRKDGMVAPEQGRGTRVIGQMGRDAAPHALAALVIYGMSRQGSAGIFMGCQAVMRRADYHLIVCETALNDITRRAEDEAAHLRSLLDCPVDGLILYAEPTNQNRELLEEIMRRGKHVVQIDRRMPGLDADYVGVDNQAAAREAVAHLIRLGHRRIAFLTLDSAPSSVQERSAGRAEALEAAGLKDDAALTVGIRADATGRPEVYRAILCRWRALSDPPTAVFCVNDSQAIEVLRACRSLGIAVPEELALVGFDNHYVASVVHPSLTTVAQPFVHIGETAAQLLLDRVTKRYTGVPRRVLLPTQLIVRESCGTGAGTSIALSERTG